MGKTKDVIKNGDGTCTFQFKDDVTGENGIFNPGANKVEMKIDGMGKASMLLSKYFFPILEGEGIPTHYIGANLIDGTMQVKELNIFPLEFVWRDKAWGSFCQVYGTEKGFPLNGLVETMLKNDELGDPRISKPTALSLNLINSYQYTHCYNMTKKIGITMKNVLETFGYELIDFKVEFGVCIENLNCICLGDEISGGIWRLLENGNPVDPIECSKRICPSYY